MRILAFVTCLSMMASVGQAGIVIGDFESGVETGWGQWDGGVGDIDDDPALSVSNEQATSGLSSVKITNVDWDQTLAYNAGTAGTLGDFEANSLIKFDVVFSKDISPNGGFQEVQNVWLNSPEGFSSVLSPGIFQGWAADSEPGVNTLEVTMDYSAIKSAWVGTPGWVELIFATQNKVDGTDNEAIYIDNVRLESPVPEPISAALLVLGGMGLLSVRARRA